MALKKIAVIEDDRFLRQQIVLSLSKQYEVVEAGDRIQGEQLLNQEKPALALIDLNLPPSGKCDEGIGLVENSEGRTSPTWSSSLCREIPTCKKR